MKKVTFTVSLDEANLLFKSLGRMPFEQVYELIGKMNEQANQQLSGNASVTPFVKNENSDKNGDGR
ncbi:hypothetical protein BH11BAC7_BH11BAC7_37150 [soil metagenome]